jgi:hypothetical protein
MRLLVWLALATLAVGCGPSAASTRGGAAPAPELVRWVDAVRRDDARAAYALLSPGRQKEVSYDDFERRWKETKVERERQAAALEAGLKDRPQLGERATVTLTGDKTATLVHEQGEWHMEAPLMGSARASSPQEALRLFAEALEARSFEGVLRLLTSTRRDGLNEKLVQFLGGLKSHAGGEIEITGDRATLRWNDGKTRWKVTLRQEGGEWRIDDVDQQ